MCIRDRGGVTSHSAIIARAMGIPCILGVKDADNVFATGDSLIVDAVKGDVYKRQGIGRLERFVADYHNSHTQLNKTEIAKNGKSVAIGES